MKNKTYEEIEKDYSEKKEKMLLQKSKNDWDNYSFHSKIFRIKAAKLPVIFSMFNKNFVQFNGVWKYVDWSEKQKKAINKINLNNELTKSVATRYGYEITKQSIELMLDNDIEIFGYKVWDGKWT